MLSKHTSQRLAWLAGLVISYSIANFAPASESDLTGADRLFQAGKWEMAREAYLAALPEITGNERARVLNRIAYSLRIQHKYEDALPYCHRVLEMQDVPGEHSAAACLTMGYSLRMLGRGREAIAALEKGSETEGASPAQAAESLLYAAWEHNNLEEPEAALEKFRKVSDVKDVHDNYVATAQLSIGRHFQNREQYEKAIAEYQKIAELRAVASSNRARARVYILECEALLEGDMPFHIKPYVSKVSTNSAKLFWVSQGDMPAGMVSVVSENMSDKNIRVSEPNVTPLPGTICHLHTVALDGLKSHTTYNYTVDCDGTVANGSFKTAPAGAAPLSFCVIGDTQSYHEGLQPLLDAMGDEKADFILHVGDLTDRGNLWGEWKGSFFDPGNNYFKQSTFWPVYGNHDGGPYFPALFERQDHNWYSFDFGNVHVIVLDSYGAGSGGKGREAQIRWLKEDLENNDKTWTFAALHVPMVATRKSLKWFGKEDFLPLLEEHEVDIVFSGHHPHYRRYYPIGKPGKRPVLHITSGGGGGPVGGFAPSPILAQGIDVNHYCRIDIDGNRLKLTAQAINGAIIDQFELVKDRPTETTIAQSVVETVQAAEIIAIYQELLTDRTYQLRLSTEEEPVAGEKSELLLDLSKLPRGPLDPVQFDPDTILTIHSAEDSPWKLPATDFRLRDGLARLPAIAPESVETISDGGIHPAAKFQLQLKKNGRLYQPFETTAVIRLISP